MYSRRYAEQEINFEASGGLINASLVMQDRETDTYWAIMSGKAIAGKLKGSRLLEIPVNEKMRWRDWVKKHPDSLVLSVAGREDLRANAYADYFKSAEGFRGLRARDTRLETKDPIFAFQLDGQTFAAPHKAIVNGKEFAVGKSKLFLFRKGSNVLFRSTSAYTSSRGFQKQGDTWIEISSGCRFDPSSGEFAPGRGSCPRRFTGFDTFWYNWSLANPDTKLLE